MNFIKKIFENKTDNKVHQQFTKFSKGVFENKAIIDINVTKKNVRIKTTPEFTNEFVEMGANTIKDKVPVKGISFCTRSIKEECPFEFKDIKNAMGVKKHMIDTELGKDDILDLINKFPFASINLSFKTDYGTLKVKEKAPKSSKPPKGGEEKPKADYCNFQTSDKSILEDFAFDIKDEFKKAFIIHTFQIDEIIIPDEYKDDFALARLHAKRKGKVKRYVDVDGNKMESEANFEA